MKYIITESRLDTIITEYLIEIFDVDNVHYTNPTEYDYETGEDYDDDTRVEFYFGDYEDENTIFKWYDCEYFYNDKSHREIANMLGVDEGTSRSQLSRAKKKIKEYLESLKR